MIGMENFGTLRPVYTEQQLDQPVGVGPTVVGRTDG
jgi:hypothetical protein